MGPASLPARPVRVGLLATQGIRGGDNRTVLERIKQTGDIFMAWSDRDWILDGANVHVSMIGFDDGAEQSRMLDGRTVAQINMNLTALADLTAARSLPENSGIYVRSPEKGAKFEIPCESALKFLRQPNPNGRSSIEVLHPWVNGEDLVDGRASYWIIDFHVCATEREAAGFEAPFQYVSDTVRGLRNKNSDPRMQANWWRFRRSGEGVRGAAARLSRLLGTTMVSKYRLFRWIDPTIQPDKTIPVFARSDDYFFGVLHSSIHELWALRMGTQLEDRPRYTPTTCFETFPLPWPPGTEPVAGRQPLAGGEALAGRDARPTPEVGQASVPASSGQPLAGGEALAGRDARPTPEVGQASVPASSGQPLAGGEVLAGRDARPTPEVGQASVPASSGAAEGCSTGKGVGQASLPASQASAAALTDFNPPEFRGATFEAYTRRLPHWRVEGATYFVTWRLLPARPDLSPEERSLVAGALRHFDGKRYHLLAWVVMSDHVHVLVYPWPGHELKELTHAWKSYTTNQMQRRFGRRGRVWLDESFDRVVRDEHELFQKLYYILNNPFKRWPDLPRYHWVGLHPALSDLGPVGAPIPVPPQYQEAFQQVEQASLPAQPPAGTEACPTVSSARHADLYQRIAAAAQEINEQRERWLNPPEWIEDWGRVIDARDRFEDVPAEARALLRHSAIMAEAARDPRFKRRTLTHLYNERPTWLKLAHEQLDRAVLTAYAAVDPEGGWREEWAKVWVETGAGQPLPEEHGLAERRKEVDQRVLANLLRMNLARARAAGQDG